MYAHGMLKVPYECLSLESRRLQKKVEKVVSNSIAVTNGLSNKIREKEEKVPSAHSDGKPADVNWDKVVGNLEKVKNMLQVGFSLPEMYVRSAQYRQRRKNYQSQIATTIE